MLGFSTVCLCTFKENRMMLQFEVFKINGGQRYVFEIDTSRYDFYIGFRRVVAVLP